MNRESDFAANLDMTPMIDVTFQLLIFFIVTLKFKILENKLNAYLPVDEGLRPQSQIVDERFAVILLRQTSAGPRNILDRPTEYIFESASCGASIDPSAISTLRRRLEDFKRQTPDAKAKLDVGLGVPAERVVHVLDVVDGLGFSEVRFVGLGGGAPMDSRFAETLRARLSGDR